jgi:hypothetical protein
MSNIQKNLIGLLFSVLIFSIAVFHGEKFFFPSKPRVNQFLSSYGINLIVTFSLFLFSYFVSKLINFSFFKIILILTFIESSYYLIFKFGPKILPESLKNSYLLHHHRAVSVHTRPLIQFSPSCAIYDSLLFYTLKPGGCNFSHFEFNNHYDINSQGLRDDENSLNSPEVIFMGDSFTMGWGVNQDETFPSLFEKMAGLKVLNSGISSYGQAREFEMLKRLKTDSLKLIVIQFHDTDLAENSYYLENGKLGEKTDEVYKSQVEFSKNQSRYFLFKYIRNALISLLSLKNENNLPNSSTFSKKTTDFFEIIAKIQNLYNANIIVNYIGSYNTLPETIEEFEKYAKLNNVNKVYFLNLANKLNPSHYFYFDDHLNAKGHKTVADEIFKIYKSF